MGSTRGVSSRRTDGYFSLILFLSKAQYERVFGKWGLKKNQKAIQWRGIIAELSRRKAKGKDSNLFINGVLVDEKKLKRKIALYTYQTTLERLSKSILIIPHMVLKRLTFVKFRSDRA